MKLTAAYALRTLENLYVTLGNLLICRRPSAQVDHLQ
jgi:hypothetical protein